MACLGGREGNSVFKRYDAPDKGLAASDLEEDEGLSPLADRMARGAY